MEALAFDRGKFAVNRPINEDVIRDAARQISDKRRRLWVFSVAMVFKIPMRPTSFYLAIHIGKLFFR